MRAEALWVQRAILGARSTTHPPCAHPSRTPSGSVHTTSVRGNNPGRVSFAPPSPRGHWSVSEDTFGFHNWGCHQHLWADAVDADPRTEHSTAHRTPQPPWQQSRGRHSVGGGLLSTPLRHFPLSQAASGSFPSQHMQSAPTVQPLHWALRLETQAVARRHDFMFSIDL